MANFVAREKVRELRKMGESITNISRITNTSKGSVSRWCSDIKLTRNQQEYLIQKSNVASNKGRLIASENKRKERVNRQKYFLKTGIGKIGTISKRELFLIGVALYWAEGGKTQRKTVFSNSDPEMVKLWIKWARNCLGIFSDRFICRVEINEIHKGRVNEIERYWSEKTDIHITQFRKPSLKHIMSKKVYKDNNRYFGTLQITISKGTNLNYEILGYIRGLSGVCDKN